MKNFFIIILFSWSYLTFASYLTFTEAPQCTIDNYRDIVFQYSEESIIPEPTRCDLRGANLRSTTLQVANLREADLRNADLREADLRNAQLQGADLRLANLQFADLRTVRLQNAKLQGADLRSTNLRGADLQHANLQGADLRHANLREANLRGANLQDADLTGAQVTATQAQYLQSQGYTGFSILRDIQPVWNDFFIKKQKSWLKKQ